MNRLLPFFLSAVLFSAPGCMTTAQAIFDGGGAKPFGGTRALFEAEARAAKRDAPPWAFALMLLDLPLSFAADIAILPYSVPRVIVEAQRKKVLEQRVP